MHPPVRLALSARCAPRPCSVDFQTRFRHRARAPVTGVAPSPRRRRPILAAPPRVVVVRRCPARGAASPRALVHAPVLLPLPRLLLERVLRVCGSDFDLARARAASGRPLAHERRPRRCCGRVDALRRRSSSRLCPRCASRSRRCLASRRAVPEQMGGHRVRCLPIVLHALSLVVGVLCDATNMLGGLSDVRSRGAGRVRPCPSTPPRARSGA